MPEANQKAAHAIRAGRTSLAEAITARQAWLQPAAGWSSSQRSAWDAGYHLDYLAEALHTADVDLFLDYVTWAQGVFQGQRFPAGTLVDILGCTRQVLQENLPADLYLPVEPYLQAAIQLGSVEILPPPSYLGQDQPQAARAGAFLAALLGLDRSSASGLVQAARLEGVSIREIYLHIFQPALREVGRLWQANQISVAMEHYCTAATQSIMTQLYPFIFSTPRIGRRLVAACVGEELHEIGIRMVCDFFEMEGWHTLYLGANTPTPAILELLGEQKVDVLAISTTLTIHLGQLADLIARVRSSGSPVKILVGGYPFNVSADLWRKVGADGSARDAQQAIAAANALLAPGPSEFILK